MPQPKARARVVSVVGARPNFVKIASFLRALERHEDVESVLVHTGQHYDANLSDVFFAQLGIRRPDFNLEVGSGTHAQQTAAVMLGFEPLLLGPRPDYVVVVGDVNSTLACALTAKKLLIPVAHIEAGLRSGDDTMPEELNRRVTDLISDLHLTTSDEARSNLLRENVPAEKVHFVGNLMIDSLFHNLERARAMTTFKEYELKAGGYALLTLHRPATVDNPERLRELSQTLARIHAECPVLFVAHPRTRQMLIQQGVVKPASDSSGWIRTPQFLLAPPVGYLEMLNLQMNAKFVMTDSGGLQEETTVLNVPCLTLRDNTERPETVTVGTNQVIGTNPSTVWLHARKILDGHFKTGRCPDLWDGHTGERAVAAIRQHLGLALK